MATNKSVLETVQKDVKVKGPSKFNPSAFFKTRPGLYVWSSFSERVLAKAKSTVKSKSFSVDSYKLLKYSTDAEIESDLSEKHTFTETEVCALIAALIQQQPKGEEGVLDSKRYNWNLFYTPTFVVVVCWRGDGWGVDGWRRDDDGWSDGRRVFSPAN